ELGPENFHGHCLVTVLRALVLAGNDNTSGEMSETDRRVSLINMLAASPAGAIGINTQILRADIYLDRLINIRVDEHRRKRGVAAGVRIKRRDAHQTVDTSLGLEIAIGIRPLNRKRGALYSTSFTRNLIHHLDLVPFTFGPTQIETEQHI